MIKIVVDGTPESNNKFMGNSHSFNDYRREKERWHWKIKTAVKDRPKEPIAKAIIQICYFFRDKRRRDPDNFSGKMLLDPLVREGILLDDSFANVELVLTADVDKAKPRTEITVIPKE